MGADSAIDTLDRWLRGAFRHANTTLEAGPSPSAARELVETGTALVAGVAAARIPDDERYKVLGHAGFLLAACARHGLDAPAVAEALCARLGDALGVAPRYVFAHQVPPAADGYRTFTTLRDEAAFVAGNSRAVLAYRAAAAALANIEDVTDPAAAGALEATAAALADLLAEHQDLTRTVAVTPFYASIRPYFTSHAVEGRTWRGVNAGDFSAVNELDLRLGLVRADDPFYARVLAEKQPYVPPEDQAALRGAAGLPSLLDAFLAAPPTPTVRENAGRFLAVVRAHGAAAAFHHTRLVKPFLVTPAQAVPPEDRVGVTASGPPLEVVVATLDRLRALRLARGPRAVRSDWTALRRSLA